MCLLVCACSLEYTKQYLDALLSLDLALGEMTDIDVLSFNLTAASTHGANIRLD